MPVAKHPPPPLPLNNAIGQQVQVTPSQRPPAIVTLGALLQFTLYLKPPPPGYEIGDLRVGLAVGAG